MITLDLQPYRKGRVWLSDLPDLLQPNTIALQRSMATDNQVIGVKRTAAVELFLPKGGRALYGLLGAEFLPNTSKLIEVRVDSVTKNGLEVPWSLASQVDQVYAGILDEYAEGVISSACASENLYALGSGIVNFRWGAHGLVGSSTHFFKRLSRIVITLLKSNASDILEEYLVSLINV